MTDGDRHGIGALIFFVLLAGGCSSDRVGADVPVVDIPDGQTTPDTAPAVPSEACTVSQKRNRSTFQPFEPHPTDGEPYDSVECDAEDAIVWAKPERLDQPAPPSNTDGLPRIDWKNKVTRSDYREVDGESKRVEVTVEAETLHGTDILQVGWHQDEQVGFSEYRGATGDAEGANYKGFGRQMPPKFDPAPDVLAFETAESESRTYEALGYQFDGDVYLGIAAHNGTKNLNDRRKVDSNAVFPLVRDAGQFSDGRLLIRWGRRRLFTHWMGLLEPTAKTLPHVSEVSLRPERVWPEGPSRTGFASLRFVDQDEAVTVLRDYPSQDQQSTPDDRLYRIGACGEPDLIWSGPAIAGEVLKIGGKYLIRSGNCGAPSAPSYPMLVAEGEMHARLPHRCRDFIQTDGDQFACLAPPAETGKSRRVLTFDDNLELLDVRPIADEVSPYDEARLALAARGGALAVLGLREGAGQLILLEDETRRTVDLPTPRDPSPAIVDEADAVLDANGRLTVLWGNRLVGIQTRYGGLAPTTYPRAVHGGNQQRGWVETQLFE